MGAGSLGAVHQHAAHGCSRAPAAAAAANSNRGPPAPGAPKRQWWQRAQQQQQLQTRRQQRLGLGQGDDSAHAAQQDLLARRRQGLLTPDSGGSKGTAGLQGERGMEEPWVDPEAAFEIKAVYCMKIWRYIMTLGLWKDPATELLFRGKRGSE